METRKGRIAAKVWGPGEGPDQASGLIAARQRSWGYDTKTL
jgi:hypothetical protein